MLESIILPLLIMLVAISVIGISTFSFGRRYERHLFESATPPQLRVIVEVSDGVPTTPIIIFSDRDPDGAARSYLGKIGGNRLNDRAYRVVRESGFDKVETTFYIRGAIFVTHNNPRDGLISKLADPSDSIPAWKQ